MAGSTEHVSVGTTATKLSTVPTDSVSGYSIAVKNLAASSADAFVGFAEVTTSNGFSVSPGETVAFDLMGEELYGIVASGTVTVHVLRSGV